jgi:hypothetical protein
MHKGIRYYVVVVDEGVPPRLLDFPCLDSLKEAAYRLANESLDGDRQVFIIQGRRWLLSTKPAFLVPPGPDLANAICLEPRPVLTALPTDAAVDDVDPSYRAVTPVIVPAVDEDSPFDDD